MSASEPGWVIVGNAGCRRVRAWSSAFSNRQRPLPRLIEYSNLLNGNEAAWNGLPSKSVIRFESAAEDTAVYRWLLCEGYEAARQEGYPALEPDRLDEIPNERGRWRFPRQAHLGFERLMGKVKLPCQKHTLSNPPEDILLQYDKTATLKILRDCRVPVPAFLDHVHGYDEIRAAFRSTGRAMVKLRHGSGGAGCIAIHWSGVQVRALTTIREVNGQLYTAKRPQLIHGEHPIAGLVEQLCCEKLHAEAWLPKTRWHAYTYDFRIVTVAGRVTHAVARGSRHPFTNLNLGNRRLPWDELSLGSRWDMLRDAAEQTAKVFPRSQTLGIDVVLHANGTSVSVLEVNAFGNLLPNLLDAEGRTTYEAAVDASP